MKDVLEEALEKIGGSGNDDIPLSNFFCFCNRIAEKKGIFDMSYAQLFDAANEKGILFQDHGLIWRVRV